jgi:chemotaxis-related protein WspB
MLVLMCHAGENRYAFDSAHVVEVVPSVNSNPVAGSPEWLAGVFAHRGLATPLVDFTRLITGHPCPCRWNSRIILARFDIEDMPEQIGLLTERVTTAEINDQQRASTTGPSSGMEALGPILLDDRGMFQLVDLSRLLTGDRRSAVQLDLSKGTS